jgi:uncharacterized protein (AIM24 family)
MARVVRFPTDEVEKLDEEFLYHLNRGAEHLAKGEPEQARGALARAAELRPRDAKALGLLGQACYRLGRFGEAAEAYGRLLQESPQEPGAQVNLGLALLKAGRPAEAVVHLERALDLNPEHKRAMGYLGLAWLEQGSVARAREWFERAGRTQMVERCDAILRGERGDKKAEEWKVAPSVSADARADAEVERELQDALRILEQGTRAAAPRAANVSSGADSPAPAVQAPTPPAAPAAAGSGPRWTATSPADVRAPAAVPPSPSTPEIASTATPAPTTSTATATSPMPTPAPLRPAPPPAGELAGAALATRTESTFTVGTVVQVAVRDEVLVRQAGLLGVEGQVELTPETRRLRGRAVPESFGTGREVMHRARGKGALLFAKDGRRFTDMQLGGAAHFREDAVFGFEAGLAFENGRLAAPGAPEIELVRLAGDGAVLVVTLGEVVAVEVVPDRPVRVSAAALVGWTGALTPRLLPLTRPQGDPDAVELSGEGRVLLDPGAPLA